MWLSRSRTRRRHPRRFPDRPWPRPQFPEFLGLACLWPLPAGEKYNAARSMGTSHFCMSAALRQKIGPAMQLISVHRRPRTRWPRRVPSRTSPWVCLRHDPRVTRHLHQRCTAVESAHPHLALAAVAVIALRSRMRRPSPRWLLNSLAFCRPSSASPPRCKRPAPIYPGFDWQARDPSLSRSARGSRTARAHRDRSARLLWGCFAMCPDEVLRARARTVQLWECESA
mmetsp:Transcript_10790/g.25508  ORF Transcript_10790/g.25508 Transcript_10790/m.25508 type:complete len:227 (-) Transcript_10790:69-749(-)